MMHRGCDYSFIQSQPKIKIIIGPTSLHVSPPSSAPQHLFVDLMGALGAQKRGLGALLLKDEKLTKMARCTFFEGRYFLGHPNTPRPISKDAGTVPAHFDLGFIGQLLKLTFRPTVVVHRVM